MFTGIVEETGIIASIKPGNNGKEITLQGNKIIEGTGIGDSIAVDGVCLTVKNISGKEFSADLSEETLKLTTLSELNPGSKVNLERALKMNNRLGGHFVTGHIDGKGSIAEKTVSNQSAEITISVPEEIMQYVVKKGSIAVNGISLTVARCDSNSFTVAIIPLTLQITNLGMKKIGDEVNIETDVIGKYIEKFLGRLDGNYELKNRKLNLNYLKEHGFA
ncbi:MAG: riboflavin synthase subunit alpha [Candidatus Schekmanbacteria bacterium RIFCSPHIGHO2_02_FULL_38_11]|uniref:Riboflavin synthase n=1 Tax=Candidatus Schekmanbacteria bacterium RIFCSPLOWO2_12_FULL_38_15 TaxID=1817883 RepID=A0A1F7SG72_9BACT|nr:MAG: riboflavin synthase subunit alpha [Candidatus Schekmanbacteria bacterium GWA2_38_9]OGL49468.1 MAG: riboflavin synthase subunit alpha [Candidatus Schekmanbacteria bacterium RIFCSPLOWO2_02_FULL_38_14]OGL52167.1 MAG: riboflavin synthase subunit alpha [Candidatus Schekmanbacteria bacterium RIFCSPLOWO2_12_FULL_38_15]OGL53578.1 MAG: riboflavin synthase subunit alpha [Candidatus Schekmanbacteria bacterium RIFCSPHIGHO2_02_FULL_38_11]